ncbi:MAG: o-succinylbenzoate synthase, partial [bacterium]|nr:o-succinylbenzoate synthase [bacterium]
MTGTPAGTPGLSRFTVKSLQLYRYSIPFKTPLQVAEKNLHSRHGLVIRVTDSDGFNGYGEIAPLPGYSRETPEQALDQTRQLARQLPGTSITMDIAGDLDSDAPQYRFPTPLPSSLPHLPQALYPSVCFGLETACYYLWARRTAHTSTGRTRIRFKPRIPVNALLHPHKPQLEQQVRQLIADGFKTIKIKVGRRSLRDDIETVTRTAQLLPPQCVIRLDANRLWEPPEAISFGRAVRHAPIRYIEEPFADTREIPRFFGETGIHVALDESLETIFNHDTYIPEGVNAIVLKPSIVGGIRRTGEFIRLARARGLTPVISSCFEAGPGFAVLLKMAAAIDFDDSASGLDTLKYLEHDLF